MKHIGENSMDTDFFTYLESVVPFEIKTLNIGGKEIWIRKFDSSRSDAFDEDQQRRVTVKQVGKDVIPDLNTYSAVNQRAFVAALSLVDQQGNYQFDYKSKEDIAKLNTLPGELTDAIYDAAVKFNKKDKAKEEGIEGN